MTQFSALLETGELFGAARDAAAFATDRVAHLLAGDNELPVEGEFDFGYTITEVGAWDECGLEYDQDDFTTRLDYLGQSIGGAVLEPAHLPEYESTRQGISLLLNEMVGVKPQSWKIADKLQGDPLDAVHELLSSLPEDQWEHWWEKSIETVKMLRRYDEFRDQIEAVDREIGLLAGYKACDVAGGIEHAEYLMQFVPQELHKGWWKRELSIAYSRDVEWGLTVIRKQRPDIALSWAKWIEQSINCVNPNFQKGWWYRDLRKVKETAERTLAEHRKLIERVVLCGSLTPRQARFQLIHYQTIGIDATHWPEITCALAKAQ